MNKYFAILLVSLGLFALTWMVMHVPFGGLGCGASSLLAPESHALEMAAHEAGIASSEKLELLEESLEDDPDKDTIKELKKAIEEAEKEESENAADLAADGVEADISAKKGQATVSSGYRWVLRFHGVFAFINVFAIFGMFFSGIKIMSDPSFSRQLQTVAVAVVLLVTSIVMLNQPAGFIMGPVSTGTSVLSVSVVQQLGALGDIGPDMPTPEAVAVSSAPDAREVCDDLLTAARENAGDCDAMERDVRRATAGAEGVLEDASEVDKAYCKQTTSDPAFKSMFQCFESNPGILDSLKSLGDP